MVRLLAGVAASLLLFAGLAAAQDKAAGPTGAWAREANGLDIKVEFVGKDTLKMSAAAGDNGLTVTAKYTVEKGVVKAKVTDVAETGKFPVKPPKGLEFSFKWAVKKDGKTAELSDFAGEGLEDGKAAVEGEYAAVKK